MQAIAVIRDIDGRTLHGSSIMRCSRGWPIVDLKWQTAPQKCRRQREVLRYPTASGRLVPACIIMPST